MKETLPIIDKQREEVFESMYFISLGLAERFVELRPDDIELQEYHQRCLETVERLINEKNNT